MRSIAHITKAALILCLISHLAIGQSVAAGLPLVMSFQPAGSSLTVSEVVGNAATIRFSLGISVANWL